MEYYFFPKPISSLPIAIITAGIVFAVIGLALLFTSGLAPLNIVLMLAGILLLIFGMRQVFAIKRSNPSDQDYDEWLEAQARAILPKALRILNLDKSQITSKILRIHSVILPGTTLASNYRDEVYLKCGKDGQWRSSVNLFTYFFPSEHFIAIFTRDINALNPNGPYDDQSEDYAYRDITTFTLSVFRDTVFVNGEEFVYRVQQLSLKTIHEAVPIGGYLSALPLDPERRAPNIILPDSRINKTLADLRALLRSKKHRIR